MPGQKRTKFAIVGFTSHKKYAPFENEEFEIWGLNDLYLDLPLIPVNRCRWFQVHEWHDPRPVEAANDFSGGPTHPRDANHTLWLRNAASRFPVYMLEPHPQVPDAVILDQERMYQYFSLDGEKKNYYFTNTISWMLGLAIMELVPNPGDQAPEGAEIWCTGVDMMVGGGHGSEYGWQRPSCEFFLSWARAAGIKVVLPDESDLCKTAFPYGHRLGNAYRAKVQAHKADLEGRLNTVRAELKRLGRAEGELVGAINSFQWLIRSWMPGDGVMSYGLAPAPNMHKEQQESAVTPDPEMLERFERAMMAIQGEQDAQKQSGDGSRAGQIDDIGYDGDNGNERLA